MSEVSRKITSRTKARRRALDIVFECDQRGWDRGEDLAEVLEERRDLSTAQAPLPPFSANLVAFLADHFDAVDHCLSHLSVKWPMRMMVSVDRCILRLGIAELWMHDGQLDAPIIIDQWVTLAAEMSTDTSPDFVNGLLQAATDTVKEDFGPTPPAEEDFDEPDPLAKPVTAEAAAELADDSADGAPSDELSSAETDETSEESSEQAGQTPLIDLTEL